MAQPSHLDVCVACALALVTWLGNPTVAWAGQVQFMTVTTNPQETTHHFKASAIINAEPIYVREFFMQPCSPQARTRILKECRVLARNNEAIWVYGLANLPFMEPRDFVSRRTLVRDLDPNGTGAFKLLFNQDDSLGPQPRRGVRRLQGDTRTITLVPVDGGTRSLVVVDATFTPGVRIPRLLAEQMAQRLFPSVVTDMETAALTARSRQHDGQFSRTEWDDIPVDGKVEQLPPVRGPLVRRLDLF